MDSLILAIATFFLSQLLLKLYIEPIQEMKKCLAKAGYVLDYYKQIPAYQESEVGTQLEDMRKEAEKEYKIIGSKLWEKEVSLIRNGAFFFIPSRKEIKLLRKKFILLSNSVYRKDEDKKDTEKEIVKILNRQVQIGGIIFKRNYVDHED